MESTDVRGNTWQQVILFILIIMGSAIFVSSAILHIRKRAFENRLEELAERRNSHRRMRLVRSMTGKFSVRSRRRSSASQADHDAAVASGAVRGRAIKEQYVADEQSRRDIAPVVDSIDINRLRSMHLDAAVESEDDLPQGNSHIRFDTPASPDRGSSGPERKHRKYRLRVMSGSGVGAHRIEAHPRYSRPLSFGVGDHFDDDEKHPSPSGPPSAIDKYLKTLNGYVGRNSQFHNLSEAERRKLGGIEYDAVCLLSWLVPAYFVLLQLLGALGVGAWITVNRPSLTRTNGLDPFWTGAFFAISAFNNSGMALLDANAVALQTSIYCLITLSFLILAGNTAFPPFLRLTLWSMKKLCPKSAAWLERRRTLSFILDHPRRVYTNLFPAPQTWWLVMSLVILNGTDWVAFEILNIGNPVTDAIPTHFRVLDGLFQAFAVRSGGFYVVPISGLRSGLLVLYVLMMYVSALPVTMTIRNTNVYEERSLGIFAEDTSGEAKPMEGKHGFMGGLKRAITINNGNSSARRAWNRKDFLAQQLRGQLGHDLWWIALAVLFITMIETGQFERDPVVFATFNVIFEGKLLFRVGESGHGAKGYM
jgi:Cation transport protein